jgi:hypothetical protein
VSEDQRERIVRGWHETGEFLPRLWDALLTAREARGRAVAVVERQAAATQTKRALSVR